MADYKGTILLWGAKGPGATAATATAATTAETSISPHLPVLTPRDAISRSVKTSLRLFGLLQESIEHTVSFLIHARRAREKNKFT